MIWPISVVGATIGALVVAILFHRATEAMRMKKYVRTCRRQQQLVHAHPLPKLEHGSILVLFSDLEYPDYNAMENNLVTYAEQLGQELMS